MSDVTISVYIMTMIHTACNLSAIRLLNPVDGSTRFEETLCHRPQAALEGAGSTFLRNVANLYHITRHSIPSYRCH